MPRDVQLSLFQQPQSRTISIEASASIAGVSTATIRNWIKTGYLEYAGKGMVTDDSFQRFQREVSGKQKLNQRANKSQKDSHDHDEIISLYLNKIKNCIDRVELLGAEYEQSLSDSYRNKEGIYYTPIAIVDDLFDDKYINTDTATFCDPCCGSGNFVMRALSLGFKPENVFAYDIDPVAVSITKKKVYKETGFKGGNIKVIDFLTYCNDNCLGKFDFIFTNPPWGKKLERKYREEIGAIIHAGASIDTCSLFFFACLNALIEGGTLGLLLPEAFFNIASFEDARKSALRNSVEKLVDYGKPFPGLLTKAQGVVLTKIQGKRNERVICKNDNNTFERASGSFSNNPKSIINMYCSQQDADVISHLFSIPNITLKNNASWGLGIVTGNNGRFVADKPEAGLIPVFKGIDITSSGIKEPSCYIPSDLSLYQQVAPIEFYEAKEKIIYRFISSRLCFVCDTEQRYVLNSANILIPNADFPVKMSMLCDLFNSDFMNWIFTKIYNTHKILRADLESLPIHFQFLDEDGFVEDKYIDNLGIERTSNGTFRVKG